MKRLLVLGDLDAGTDPSIDEAVVSLAITLAKANIGFVCQGRDGGPTSLIRKMGATVQEHDGRVTSVTVSPSPFKRSYTVDESDEFLATSSRHECKMLLSKLSTGVLALPGRIGVLEILMEYLTWLKGTRQVRPIYIGNVAGFWDPLLKMFEQMGARSFLPTDFSKRYILLNDISDLGDSVETTLVDGECDQDPIPSDSDKIGTSIPKLALKQACVYCGSTSGNDPSYAEAARTLGGAIAKAGLGLVYGGGNSGLMGILATAAMNVGGKVTGIMPRSLIGIEGAFLEISSYHEVRSYHERKMQMCNLSDLFIALPGGPGTLEELVEQLAWAELGYHTKPIFIVNVDGYWNPLLALLKQMYERLPGSMNCPSKYVVVNRPEEAVELFVDGCRSYE